MSLFSRLLGKPEPASRDEASPTTLRFLVKKCPRVETEIEAALKEDFVPRYGNLITKGLDLQERFGGVVLSIEVMVDSQNPVYILAPVILNALKRRGLDAEIVVASGKL
jgi:hypothetical protein